MRKPEENDTSLVSIVIPTYNREKYISEAIECCIHQTYKNIEIIIVDNKSTDKTWSVISDYADRDARIRCYQNESNLGPVLNWQEGFKRAKGAFVKILWSDDMIAEDFIEKALAVFTDDTAFVFSWQKVIGTSDATYKTSKTVYSRKEYFKNVFIFARDTFPVSPGCALFRREDLLNSFVLDIPNNDNLDSKRNGAGNDFLIFLNTALRYDKIKVLPYCGSFFRAHTESFTVKDNLSLYYDYAKIFFLKENNFSSFYKDVFKWRLLRSKAGNKALYNSINKDNKFTYLAVFNVPFYLLFRISRSLLYYRRKK